MLPWRRRLVVFLVLIGFTATLLVGVNHSSVIWGFLSRPWPSNVAVTISLIAIIVNGIALTRLGNSGTEAARSTLLCWSCNALPTELRERYLEEWEAHLIDLPRRRRLPYVLGLLLGLPRLVIALRWPLWRPVR